jgi:hypothetical protein
MFVLPRELMPNNTPDLLPGNEKGTLVGLIQDVFAPKEGQTVSHQAM